MMYEGNDTFDDVWEVELINNQVMVTFRDDRDTYDPDHHEFAMSLNQKQLGAFIGALAAVGLQVVA